MRQNVGAFALVTKASEHLQHAVLTEQFLRELICSVLSHARGQAGEPSSNSDDKIARNNDEVEEQSHKWNFVNLIIELQGEQERPDKCGPNSNVYCIPMAQMTNLMGNESSKFFQSFVSKLGVVKSALIERNSVTAKGTGIVVGLVNHTPDDTWQLDTFGISNVLQVRKCCFDLMQFVLGRTTSTKLNVIEELDQARHAQDQPEQEHLNSYNQKGRFFGDLKRQISKRVDGPSNRHGDPEQSNMGCSSNDAPGNKPVQIDSYMSEKIAHLISPLLDLFYSNLRLRSMKLVLVPHLFTSSFKTVNSISNLLIINNLGWIKW
ncbi:hypothetical protein PsAD14_05751 [Pseudovibrio sp. Ad14]|nr:hypothetical protein PsAD14_05751 [Pseudovibrio sp. Ad14]